MNEEKIKVESLDIIVTMIDGKPYYEIKYKEVGKRHYNIGYSSYNLDFVLEWREQYFEVIENKAAKDTNVPSKWIPCSERLPEVDGMYTTTLSGELVGTDKPFVGQSYFEDGYWEEDGDCVIAWMPLPDPYREVTEEENLESRR